ncbi:MAG: gamma-glutamyltransferase, partial [Deltaproteobacteria bacterium]|nr:gamma-glutamyltransferase [Deltaproteobacteria bacterium]
MPKFKKTGGIIACGHPLTAEAGARMLEAGGNAVDAAVAAAFASCVCEATLTGLWGGGFALVFSAPTRSANLFDFFVNMPGLGKQWSRDGLDFKGIQADFRGALQEFHIGRASVGVPGNVLGFYHLHKVYGALPFGEVLAPAIAFAKNGFPVTKNQAFVSQILKPFLTDTPGARQVFAPKGALLSAGEKLHIPQLATTLEALAREGPRLFYQGELGQKMAAFFQDGGLITQKDLDAYRVMVRKPLKTIYRGETILMNPKPSSGGNLIAYSLKLLEARSFRRQSFASADFLKILIEVMRQTNQTRGEKEKRNPNLLGSTTHISVMDEAGNAVGITTSHGSGAGIAVPGLGLPFNNMLGEEDLNPLGFFQMPAGVRFSSMMCPVMAVKRGRPRLVLGSGGSNRLRTAILQALVKRINFKMPLKKAVEGVRIHWEADLLNVEPGLPQKTVQALLDFHPKSVLWKDRNFFFGGVHAVERKRNRLNGAGDPRRGGVV